MGRAYKQWVSMRQNENRYGGSKQTREFGRNLRKENEDLWERANELGVFGRADDDMGWSLRNWNKGGLKKGSDKMNLWKQASMAMGMGDISNEKDLKKLLETYDKAGIKNFDSANDVMDFKKAYEKEQFKNMFEKYAEEWGIEAPEGYQWGKGRGPKLGPDGKPIAPIDTSQYGGPNDPRRGWRHPNDNPNWKPPEYTGTVYDMPGRPEGVNDNQLRDITKWLGIEDADSWGRRGDRDSNLTDNTHPAYRPGAPVQAVPGADGYRSSYYGGQVANYANDPLTRWHLNQAGGQNPYLQYGAGPMTRG